MLIYQRVTWGVFGFRESIQGTPQITLAFRLEENPRDGTLDDNQILRRPWLHRSHRAERNVRTSFRYWWGENPSLGNWFLVDDKISVLFVVGPGTSKKHLTTLLCCMDFSTHAWTWAVSGNQSCGAQLRDIACIYIYMHIYIYICII